MSTISLTCRTHGGIFKAERKRGRRPVSCDKGLGPCSRSNPDALAGAKVTVKVEKPADKPELTKNNRTLRQGVKKQATVTVTKNLSLPPALAAKERLTALGWEVKGAANNKAHTATVTATRGEELITITWTDGKKTDERYSIWDVLNPTQNGQPKSQVMFDTNQISDLELGQLLRGQKVTWWNKLGGNQESAVISAKTLSVEWLFKTDDNGHAEDPTPQDRIIKFVDNSGGGYRAFRLGALLKVG